MLPVFHVSRLRFQTDGKGITSLIGVSGCPNQCQYCINYFWLEKEVKRISAQELYDLVSVDDIYFQATGGGITFGGGEPLMWPEGICEFAQIVNGKWKINLETSLNVPWENVERVLPYIDAFIVDVKDMNEEIYLAYTGNSGKQMRDNLARLADGYAHKIMARIPSIPEYNTAEDVKRSKTAIENMGIHTIDVFQYRKCEASWHKDAVQDKEGIENAQRI